MSKGKSGIDKLNEKKSKPIFLSSKNCYLLREGKIYRQWLTVDGDQVDDSLMVWKVDQPNNKHGVEFHVSNCHGYYLQDDNEFQPYGSICDISP